MSLNQYHNIIIENFKKRLFSGIYLSLCYTQRRKVFCTYFFLYFDGVSKTLQKFKISQSPFCITGSSICQLFLTLLILKQSFFSIYNNNYLVQIKIDASLSCEFIGIKNTIFLEKPLDYLFFWDGSILINEFMS